MTAALCLPEDGPPCERDRYSEHEAPTRPSILPLGIIDELWDAWNDDDLPTRPIERTQVTTRGPEPLGVVVGRVLEEIRRRDGR